MSSGDETVRVRKGVGDHHYANVEGYVLAFNHLFPRIAPRPDNSKPHGVTADEMMFIIHLSSFDFAGEGDAMPRLSTIARLMGVSLRTVHNYKQSCVDAGLLTITSGKSAGVANEYDFSALYLFCYQHALDDGWFTRRTLFAKSGGGMQTSAHLGMQGSAQGGVQTSAHIKDIIKDSDSKTLVPNGTPEPIVPYTSVSTKSPQYLDIEAVVKDRIYGGVSIGQQGGTICAYLVIQHATPTDLTAFCAWYLNDHGSKLPREIARTAKTDTFQGKFVTWWETWKLAVTPRPVPARREPRIGCPSCGGLGLVAYYEGEGYKAVQKTRPCECTHV